LNISKLTKDPEVVQDILQEVFITLWEKRLSLDENKPVANWLFTVSYNKSITWLKNSLRESTRVSFLYGDTQEPDKNESSIREMRLCQIESAVQQLSPQKNKVFVLCKLQGKTYDETAKELKISKHTVKEYLSEAVFNIKEYVKKHPQFSTVFFCTVLTFLIL
jgi:RNA polymerase sigma-70 factor (ECF subfamily)